MQEIDANACSTETNLDSNFEQLKKEMKTDIYWIRFFCRPCCPAPDFDGAVKMLDRLSAEVQACESYTDGEKAELTQFIEDRKEWYPHSGLCRR